MTIIKNVLNDINEMSYSKDTRLPKYFSIYIGLIAKLQEHLKSGLIGIELKDTSKGNPITNINIVRHNDNHTLSIEASEKGILYTSHHEKKVGPTDEFIYLDEWCKGLAK